MCCSCINLTYSSLYYYYAHVGQVETSVHISAMVTGIAGFEPRLRHFPFISFPFILFFLYNTHLVQHFGPDPTWCNANTIAPNLAYIRGSLWIIKSFCQLTNWSYCKLCEGLGTGSKYVSLAFSTLVAAVGFKPTPPERLVQDPSGASFLCRSRTKKETRVAVQHNKPMMSAKIKHV